MSCVNPMPENSTKNSAARALTWGVSEAKLTVQIKIAD
jgi:hypothetical protein